MQLMLCVFFAFLVGVCSGCLFAQWLWKAAYKRHRQLLAKTNLLRKKKAEIDEISEKLLHLRNEKLAAEKLLADAEKAKNDLVYWQEESHRKKWHFDFITGNIDKMRTEKLLLERELCRLREKIGRSR